MGTIKAAIWRNETTAGVRHSITFRRLYTQMDGAKKSWKSSDSFGRDDLLVLAKVADQAHTRILELQERDQAPRSFLPPLSVRPCGTAASIADRTPDRLSGRSRALSVVCTAIMPQPMSTPTAAGMIAPFVGITEPIVAPMPQ